MRHLASLAIVSILLVSSEPRSFAADETPEPRITVKLIDPGSEPRKALRYESQKGEKESVLMTMEMSNKMTLAGQQLPPQPRQVMEMDFRLNVTDATDDTIGYRFELLETKAVGDEKETEAFRNAVNQQLQKLNGLQIDATVDRRGFTQKAEIIPPKDAPESILAMFKSMESSVKEMSAPMPEEPVGVGAKWTVEQEVTTNGMEIAQVSDFDLKELSGDTVTLSVKVTQTADPQELSLPGLPANATVKLDKFSGGGEGTMKLSLQKLVPTSLIEYESDLQMLTSINDEEQTLNVSTSMKMQVAPKE